MSVIHYSHFTKPPVALCTLERVEKGARNWSEVTCLDCIRGEIKRLEAEVHCEKMAVVMAEKTLDSVTGKKGGELRTLYAANIQQMHKNEEWMRHRSVSHPWRWDSATRSPLFADTGSGEQAPLAPTAPAPRVLDCAWVPDGRAGASAGDDLGGAA